MSNKHLVDNCFKSNLTSVQELWYSGTPQQYTSHKRNVEKFIRQVQYYGMTGVIAKVTFFKTTYAERSIYLYDFGIRLNVKRNLNFIDSSNGMDVASDCNGHLFLKLYGKKQTCAIVEFSFPDFTKCNRLPRVQHEDAQKHVCFDSLVNLFEQGQKIDDYRVIGGGGR